MQKLFISFILLGLHSKSDIFRTQSSVSAESFASYASSIKQNAMLQLANPLSSSMTIASSSDQMFDAPCPTFSPGDAFLKTNGEEISDIEDEQQLTISNLPLTKPLKAITTTNECVCPCRV